MLHAVHVALLVPTKVPLPHGVCVLLPEQATPGSHGLHLVRVVSVPGKGWGGDGKEKEDGGLKGEKQEGESKLVRFKLWWNRFYIPLSSLSLHVNMVRVTIQASHLQVGLSTYP